MFIQEKASKLTWILFRGTLAKLYAFKFSQMKIYIKSKLCVFRKKIWLSWVRSSNEMLLLLHACSAPLLIATLSIDFKLEPKRHLYFWNFRSVIVVESMAEFSQRQVNILRNQLRELKSFCESYRVMRRRTTFGMRVEVVVLLTRGKKYVLRVDLPPNFPNSCPSMFVIAPDGILRRKDHSSLRFESRQDHILDSQHGYTRIAHFPPNHWFGNETLLQVIQKGLVWLEAYEMHLKQGYPINWFVQVVATVLQDETFREL